MNKKNNLIKNSKKNPKIEELGSTNNIELKCPDVDRRKLYLYDINLFNKKFNDLELKLSSFSKKEFNINNESNKIKDKKDNELKQHKYNNKNKITNKIINQNINKQSPFAVVNSKSYSEKLFNDINSNDSYINYDLKLNKSSSEKIKFPNDKILKDSSFNNEHKTDIFDNKGIIHKNLFNKELLINLNQKINAQRNQLNKAENKDKIIISEKENKNMETKSKKYNDLSENIINDKTRFKTSEININENLNIIQNSINPYSSEYKINSTNNNLDENNDIINNIKMHEENNENNIQNELMKNDNNLDNLILETSHHNALIQSSLMPNIKQDKEKNINISIIYKNKTKEEKVFDDIIISENNVENKSKSQEKKIYNINIKSYLKIIKLLLGNKEKKEAMNVSLFNEYEKYFLTIKNYFDNLKTKENNGKSIIKGNNKKKLIKKEYKILIQKLIEKINIKNRNN